MLIIITIYQVLDYDVNYEKNDEIFENDVKTKGYTNVTYVIVLKTSIKTSITITISFKNAIIICKIEFIIIIIDIAISEEDIYLYNRIIFLYLFRCYVIFVIIRFLASSQLRLFLIL